MANQQHLDVLKQGVEVWNQWREQYPAIRPDLRGADLSDANLSSADLSLVNFNGAHLSHVRFSNANLSGAYFRGANLSGADLTGAKLSLATFGGTNLSGADLTGARVLFTIFAGIDLSQVKGLETVVHGNESYLDIHTIYRSKGKIPEAFLRGIGTPETMIEYIHSMLGSSINYYSCFISYSSKDETFVKQLYADLQSNAIRCWFAPEDLKIGAEIRFSIDESIRLHDKLLLVLSRYSVVSQWVEQEVERALARERKENKIVLFPIRLDNAVMEIEGGWPALIRNTRNIGDFTRWKRHDAYQKALERLLHDLKAQP